MPIRAHIRGSFNERSYEGTHAWLARALGYDGCAQDVSLPLWVCKTVGGTTVHWAGASLRFQGHEFRTPTVYGNIAGANLLDWPITLQELEPFYTRAEDKLGVTGTHNIPRLPGNNNFKVMAAGAKRVGYTEIHTGNMAINVPWSRPHCCTIDVCDYALSILQRTMDRSTVPRDLCAC
jgi:choline dehydrogenase-like flavoprotein